jgi:hypothetical protein
MSARERLAEAVWLVGFVLKVAWWIGTGLVLCALCVPAAALLDARRGLRGWFARRADERFQGRRGRYRHP